LDENKDGTYGIAVFNKDGVVSADGDKEEYSLGVVEYVDPLLPFTSLSANIKHAVYQIAHIEIRLAYAGGAKSSVEDILICW